MSTRFTAVPYGDGRAETIAALVTGIGGQFVDFEQAAEDLACAGHDVVVYSYDDLFREGDPRQMHDIIRRMSDDFQKRAAGYEWQRFTGYSLGMGLAFNMQKDAGAPCRTGLYAAGGIDAARNTFRNPVIRYGFKQHAAFVANGYTERDVQKEWAELSQPPLSPMVVALGGLDFIVSYPRARLSISRLRESGVPIRVITEKYKEHNGMKQWFNQNMLTMLGAAQMFDIK